MTAPKTVSVPSCVGLKVSACEKKLQNLGLEVNTTIEAEESDEIEKNRVIRTDPEEGRSIKEGTVVTIYKSLGEEIYVVEDYLGKNYIEVQTILETKYGLVVNIEKKDVTDTSDKEYEEQEIIGQSLAAGSEIKEGESITLFIPNVMDTFPDMNAEGWTVDDVRVFADKYQLNLTVQEQETTQYEAGKVISQSRAVGSQIYKGTSLRIVVAKAPEKTSSEDKETNSGDNTTDKDENS